jgi:hypothetical protein
MDIGSTQANISVLPSCIQSWTSSSVAQVVNAPYRCKQQFPHCVHLKPLGGMGLSALPIYGRHGQQKRAFHSITHLASPFARLPTGKLAAEQFLNALKSINTLQL